MIRRTVFIHIPYRGERSIAEHRELVELIRGEGVPEEIEAVARTHKLRTVESFRAWRERNSEQ
jgi:hypothetical protein